MELSVFSQYLPDLLKGLGNSVVITTLGMIFGVVIGLLAAVSKKYKIKFFHIVSTIYIELFRNTPLLIQLYLLYFGLGQLGIQIHVFLVAFIGLSLNNAAYIAEIFRSGFKVVDKGIIEAGHALGFDKYKVFTNIISFPTFKAVFPALTNQFILMFLFSSVTSTIAFEDLTYQIMNINAQTSLTLQIFIIGTIIYYIASQIISFLLNSFEKKVFKW